MKPTQLHHPFKQLIFLNNEGRVLHRPGKTLTMLSFKIKKLTISVVLFLTAFFFFGFIGFAAILTVFFLYRLVKRSVNTGDIRRAGVPTLTAIFLVGLFSTATLSPYPFSAWNIGKDVYFFLAPVMMLMLGLTFLNNSSDFERTLKTAVYTLTIISIFQFSDFLLGGGIFNISLENRYEYRMDSTAATVALLLIVSLRPTLKSLLGNTQLSAAAILNLLLIIASLSRVNLIIAIFALVFVFLHIRPLRIAMFVAILFMIAAPVLPLPVMVSGGAISDGSSFFDKVLNSLQEFRISDYSNWSEINKNWRGYEAFLGVDQVFSVGGWANYFGVGFGSFATGPFEGKLEQIPFFHNGFITIFLKSGALGIAIFSMFAGKLYLTSRAAFLHGRSISDPRIVRAGLLIFLLTSSMLLRTLSTHGVYYSRTTIELFFIGLSIYFIFDLRRKNVVTKRFREDDSLFVSQKLPRAGLL